jgi:RHS repeat-associated protein
LGNLTGLTDENLHTTQNLFDVLSEPVQKTLPDQTVTESRNYDTAGNLVSLTHFNQVTTTYAYDQLNRLLSRSTPGEATVSFTYTATGKRQTMIDASGTTSYGYDSLDRLSSKATPEGTLNYTYDAGGNLTSMASSNANGTSVSYGYDDFNRLISVIDNRLPGSNTTTYAYDPANNLATATYPNGLLTQFQYDRLNRVSGSAAQVSGYSYQRNAVGNLTGALELNGRAVNWAYDGINRLTIESIAAAPSTENGNLSYGFDPVGNRISISSSLSGINSGSFSFNVDDEVSSESYDRNGNTIATGAKTFAYNSQNQLISMNGGAVTILYDGDGNRVAETVGGVTTRYLVDDLNPTGYPQVVEELSGSLVDRQYTYGLQRISENQVLNNAWTPSFYGYDGGENVRYLENAAGAVTDTYEYDSYGNQIYRSGATSNNFMYRGEQNDPHLGLYYLRARHYNALTGRFVSRDPDDGFAESPGTLHKYLYADGNPVGLIDPSGRAAFAEVIQANWKDFAVAAGLTATAVAINCIYRWNATNFTTTVDTGLYGGQNWRIGPCDWLWRSAPAIPASKPTTITAAPTTTFPNKQPPCPQNEDNHHMLPQQFRSWFAKCGIPDIDSPEFTQCVPRACHTGSGGLHSNQNGPGTSWNGRWAAFIGNGECPAGGPQAITNFMNQLEQEFIQQLLCIGGSS